MKPSGESLISMLIEHAVHGASELIKKYNDAKNI
jgi:hypothetical protein